MTAFTETTTEGLGQSTRDGSRPSVGDATRALTLPQLPYGDAVHTALAEAGLAPEVLESGLRTGLRGSAELFLRLVWPPEHSTLGWAVREYGLTLAWSHVTGWSAHDRYGDCLLLDVDALTAPDLIREAVAHLTCHRMAGGWEPSDRMARWSEAVYLDIALAHFDEKEGFL
ncbi:hypothetical protein ACIQCF_33360 [Streptomyces sp. NPDC088353]|uniref:hypothetical protein n=1 Tax=Streptomyces sp. NPDC088353 TaxID=3365855 RepID=UPI0038207A34